MRRDIVRDVAVVHPHATEPRFAAEDDRLRLRRGGGAVVFVAHDEIDFDARARPARLLPEVIAEVLRELPCVAVHVDDHESIPLASTGTCTASWPGSHHQNSSRRLTHGQMWFGMTVRRSPIFGRR